MSCDGQAVQLDSHVPFDAHESGKPGQPWQVAMQPRAPHAKPVPQVPLALSPVLAPSPVPPSMLPVASELMLASSAVEASLAAPSSMKWSTKDASPSGMAVALETAGRQRDRRHRHHRRQKNSPLQRCTLAQIRGRALDYAMGAP